eukprot:PhF_6_TR18568/c0_g1_i1/m.27124
MISNISESTSAEIFDILHSGLDVSTTVKKLLTLHRNPVFRKCLGNTLRWLIHRGSNSRRLFYWSVMLEVVDQSRDCIETAETEFVLALIPSSLPTPNWTDTEAEGIRNKLRAVWFNVLNASQVEDLAPRKKGKLEEQGGSANVGTRGGPTFGGFSLNSQDVKKILCQGSGDSVICVRSRSAPKLRSQKVRVRPRSPSVNMEE